MPSVAATKDSKKNGSVDIIEGKSSTNSAAPSLSPSITNTVSGVRPSSSGDSTLRPGLLSVHVYDGIGLTLPQDLKGKNFSDDARQLNSSNTHFRSKSQHFFLPYIVMEFDKNQIVVDANRGNMSSPIWDYNANFDVSRESQLSLQIYLRSNPVSGQSTVSDPFLGSIKLQPNFEPNSTVEEWVNLSGGTGSIRLSISYQANQNKPITIDSFDLLKVVGKGSFGKVMQVRKIDTSRIYALKTIRKAHIVSRSEVVHTLAERTVLAQVNNPFIVPLKFSFQSPEKLYLVLAFVNGGELFHHLQREGRFSVDRSRFYAAELLTALECLHDFNVIYRDLKPENILLDYNGHIALCDFGLCKLNMAESDKTNTFCGTPEYLAPELLLGQGYSKSVDWWTLGILLYEMMCGLPPYYDENTNEMYRKILYDPLRFNDDMDRDARSLLTGLLTRDPDKRLGNGGAHEIKNHPFFASVDWKKLVQKKIQPPFKPSVV